MREILFRAYDKGRKEYLSAGRLFITINKNRYPNQSEIYLDLISNADKYKERFIIEQYTGLVDKNNRKIFEGDIVKGKDNLEKDIKVYGYIDHKNGSFVIVGDLMTHYRWLDYDVEVIGNIHDNPELLEESRK